MKRISRIGFIGTAALMLAGCRGLQADTAAASPEPAAVPAAAQYDPDFQLYIEKQCRLALYEPETGCYLGAYILSGQGEASAIETFEELTGKPHSFYTYFMKMGGAFPTEWVLNCIAEMKTPHIVLSPQNIENPFSTVLLEETAKRFGEFYVPIFVNLYPVSSACGYDREEYIAYFQKAKEIFARYASNVAFVWSVDQADLAEINTYYPGDDYVDWVGLNLYATINPGEDLNSGRLMQSLDYFYYTFQQDKPIMISQLGISHFSTKNHVYYSFDAGEIIADFYTDIRENYPRVKAINYMDYNGINTEKMEPGDDNFSISGNDKVLARYAAAADHGYFLASVDFSSGGEDSRQLMKSPFQIIYLESAFYIEEKNIQLALDHFTPKTAAEPLVMESCKFYPISVIESGNRKARADFNTKKVVVGEAA